MHCMDCGLEYTDAEEDTREHNRRHRAWEKAAVSFGFRFMAGELEAKKSEFWSNLHKAGSVEEQVDAILGIVRCHFERSAFGCDGHPDFTRYARAYHVSRFGEGYPTAWAEFRRRYPYQPTASLRPNYSVWTKFLLNGASHA